MENKQSLLLHNKTKQQILNLSSDLRRISWWACDRETRRDILIEKFLNLAKKQGQTLRKKNKKLNEIIKEEIFDEWPKVKFLEKERIIWAEELLTASLRLKHLVAS